LHSLLVLQVCVGIKKKGDKRRKKTELKRKRKGEKRKLESANSWSKVRVSNYLELASILAPFQLCAVLSTYILLSLISN
jgi:hypothetical protein